MNFTNSYADIPGQKGLKRIKSLTPKLILMPAYVTSSTGAHTQHMATSRILHTTGTCSCQRFAQVAKTYSYLPGKERSFHVNHKPQAGVARPIITTHSIRLTIHRTAAPTSTSSCQTAAVSPVAHRRILVIIRPCHSIAPS